MLRLEDAVEYAVEDCVDDDEKTYVKDEVEYHEEDDVGDRAQQELFYSWS